MQTKRITCPDQAAAIIRGGGVVAFPTETVFGLGVDATNPAAVQRLFWAKGRPGNNPLIVHLPDFKAWPLAAKEMPTVGEHLLAAFAPGPITVVLPKQESIDARVTAQLTTVGIRIPDHSTANRILARAGVPVAAPSANFSGRPSGTTWQSVLEDLDGRIDAVFCENSTGIGIESTVVDGTADPPSILRLGAVTVQQIRSICPQAMVIADPPESQRTGDQPVRSPGLLHPHYQPRATVQLVDQATLEYFNTPPKSAYCGMDSFDGIQRLAYFEVFESPQRYAAGFYEFLREADRRSVDQIVVQAATGLGVGQALLDRQRRSAGA